MGDVPNNYEEECQAYRDGKLAGEPVFEKPAMADLTAEERISQAIGLFDYTIPYVPLSTRQRQALGEVFMQVIRDAEAAQRERDIAAIKRIPAAVSEATVYRSVAVEAIRNLDE